MAESLQTKLSGKVLSFYDFIEGARTALKSKQVDPALVATIQDRVEVAGQSRVDEGPPDVSFQSAIYHDIETISCLFPYLESFERRQLEDFQQLIGVETAGLTGDLSPREKMSGTIPGAVFAGVGLSLFWFGFWGNFYSVPGGEDIFSMFKDWLTENSWVEFLLILVILLGGTYGVISYVYQNFKNRRQVSFLRSIHRSITLYLLVSSEKEPS